MESRCTCGKSNWDSLSCPEHGLSAMEKAGVTSGLFFDTEKEGLIIGVDAGKEDAATAATAFSVEEDGSVKVTASSVAKEMLEACRKLLKKMEEKKIDIHFPTLDKMEKKLKQDSFIILGGLRPRHIIHDEIMNDTEMYLDTFYDRCKAAADALSSSPFVDGLRDLEEQLKMQEKPEKPKRDDRFGRMNVHHWKNRNKFPYK